MRNAAVLLLLVAPACGPGGETVRALAQAELNEPPTVEVFTPCSERYDLERSTGALVRIDWADDDPDSDALTTLLADRDEDLATTADQVIIAVVPEADGAPQRAVWDTTGVPLGSYGIFARTWDFANPPVAAMAPARAERPQSRRDCTMSARNRRSCG